MDSARGLKNLWNDVKVIIIDTGNIGKWNWVINNQILLTHYRNLAKQIYENSFPGHTLNPEKYNDEKFNSFIFSVIQYQVACLGKDKKVEKLRAFYSLSRTLMVCCFFFIIFIFVANMVSYLSGWLEPQKGRFAVTFLFISLFLIVVFFFRMKKSKKFMTLIMLRNYDAILRTSKDTFTATNSSNNESEKGRPV